MFRRLRRLLPTRERLHKSRWLAWLGPRLHNPILWRWSRHEVALGAALGVFFSLILPLAHMPLSAAAAVAMRANIPMAMAATWVINPVTMAPIYYSAYRLGNWVVGADPTESLVPPALADTAPPPEGTLHARLAQYGKPFAAGMAILATAAAVVSYALTRALWWLLAWLKRARPHRA
jgi:uncharacterized protein (DUF2062 family)